MKTKFKKSISAMLAALLLLSLVVPASAATIGITPLIVGVGTEQHPIEITEAAQLEEIAAKVNAGDTFFNSAYYKLANDIDLSGYANWTPIGKDVTYSFKGNFDGSGFVISNMKISATSANKGLFGYTSGATIKNLGVVNVNITGSYSYCGGVAGYAIAGTIVSNCYTTGTVSGGIGIGGVVGWMEGSTVSNCYSTAKVTSNSNYPGGVVGLVAGASGTVEYCYATGAITGSGVGGSGGVVGSNGAGTTVKNCVALNPSVTNTGNPVGRVVGAGAGTSKSNYAFASTLNGTTGSGTDSGTNATVTNIINANVWTSAEWNSNANWQISGGSLPILKTTTGATIGGQDGVIPGHISQTGTGSYFTGGTGADANNAYEINTAEQLAQLAALVNAGNTSYNNKFYKLTADIDLAGYNNWTPIGISSNAFKGNFDGGGFVVKNLTLNATGSYHGLFGFVSGGVIKNLGVINVNINGGNCVGAVVGCINDVGKITNCYSTGKVRGVELVGGIAGYVYGTHSTTAAEMANCYSAATVSGTNEVGGVAGRLYYNGTTTSAKMLYCYAIGAVSGTDKIGGVVGWVGNTNVTLSNCIALNPSVTGTTNVGRVVGAGTTGLSNLQGYQYTLVNGATVGTGGTTTIHGQLRNSVDINGTIWTTAGFSTTNWTIAANKLSVLKNPGGAEIRGQDDTIPAHINAVGSPFDGVGTEASPYQITTAAQLAQLAAYVNANNSGYNTKYYELMNDIDLSGYNNWTPIGNGTNKFLGKFDGGGFVVKNLTITSANSDNGLFGVVENSTVTNLGVLNVNITGGTSTVGGVAGSVLGASEVSNCYTTGTITTTATYVGGVVGHLTNASAIMKYCYSTVTVMGGSQVGGVYGRRSGGAASNCVALNPKVTGTTVQRVGNVAGGTNNYAWSAMPGSWNAGDKTHNGQSGADATGAQAMSTTFWTAAANWNTSAWDTSIWTIESGNLPILKGVGSDQTGDAGVYLGLTEWSSFADGTGITGGGATAGDPYIITTAAQLAYVAQQVNANASYSTNKFFELGDDIDIGAHLWVPIGTSNANSFKGTFDGNGKTISGLTINGSYLGVGLFGYTSNATLKNIGVDVAAFNNTYKTSANHNGGLVGGCDGSTMINNCYVTGGTINADVHSGSVIGGLAGYTNNTATVTNCYVTNLITAPGVTAVGGLIGNHVNSGAATYSYWNSSITNGKGVGNALGTGCVGKTTADMKLDAFANLLNTNKADATINWTIVAGKNNGYPLIINGDSESNMQTVINDTTTDSGFSVQQSNLDEVIEHVVTPEDKSGGKTITLSLNVSDIGGETSETEAIKAAAGKVSEVYFFDVSLVKSVDDGGNVTPETLTSIPVPLEIHIKLTEALTGKTYYKVYRYHDGVAEQISNDTSKTEHYVIDVAASEIIIYTMKFSTYAIFGNDYTLDFDEGYDVDVQAKITGEEGSVYKIDIAWGAMVFEYSTSGVWNPDTHSYDENATVGWLQEGFVFGNNKITAYNHSNSDVLVSFEITETYISGTTMTVKQINSANDNTAAVGVPLGRVPQENDPAPSIDAYLWLDGKPDNLSATDGTAYTKIAVITVTIEATGGERTPKKS